MKRFFENNFLYNMHTVMNSFYLSVSVCCLKVLSICNTSYNVVFFYTSTQPSNIVSQLTMTWRKQLERCVWVIIPCLEKGWILFCKSKNSDSNKKVSETNIIEMLESLIENIFATRYVWWTYFSTDSRMSCGCQLCFFSRRLVPFFVRGMLHIGAS